MHALSRKSVLFAAAVLAASLPAHTQQPPTTQTQTQIQSPSRPQDTPPAAAAQSPAPDGNPAPPRSRADRKQFAKQQNQQEKLAREQAKDVSYLKLQGNENVAPTLDADGKPVELQQCARKGKECIKKRKALLHRKKVGMKIENGTLTVDGWTGKARLNYDISEVKFLYVSVPGSGTVVLSKQQFPNSVEQKRRSTARLSP